MSSEIKINNELRDIRQQAKCIQSLTLYWAESPITTDGIALNGLKYSQSPEIAELILRFSKIVQNIRPDSFEMRSTFDDITLTSVIILKIAFGEVIDFTNIIRKHQSIKNRRHSTIWHRDSDMAGSGGVVYGFSDVDGTDFRLAAPDDDLEDEPNKIDGFFQVPARQIWVADEMSNTLLRHCCPKASQDGMRIFAGAFVTPILERI